MTKALFRFKTQRLALLALALSAISPKAHAAQVTIAIQDFEVSPSGPVWTYTGTPAGFESGFSSGSAAPAGSPVGVGGSRAWHVVSVSGGNPLVFDNIAIPSGYDRIVATFRLASMNLLGASGGPDNLDYVLTAYSLDGGANFVDRVRVRGALADNSFWGYDATGVASVNYLPGSEALFQPTNSGLQTTQGYSTVEIEFPGSITQLSLRITPRSSSSTDSWLIDNVALIGEGETSVPEPATVIPAAAGLLVLAAAARRRKAKA
jgi:MYXO-CTERM domain-containing protein